MRQQPVQGSRLAPRVQARILASYVHRRTFENQRNVPTMERSYIEDTDAEWLASHAFYVTLGGELDRRYNYCEPYYAEPV